MADEFPLVTVIVPARPGQEEIGALAGCRALDYPVERLEIIVARGKQPAVQRNAALRQARGELIYFLDDDAVPQEGNLRRALDHLRKNGVEMVGGPNLCPAEAPLLERVFAGVLSSWLAFGPSRARYESVGKVRETTEKELILCNLLARREGLLAAGGFDESLYPNEENALMDELVKRGGKLIYDPELIVFRRPRQTLGAFGKMLFNYGRGRAEQFRLHPSLGSVLNFVPPLFCFYVIMLPVWSRWGWWALVPLWLYGLALFLETLASALGKAGWKSWLAWPLIVVTHLVYGIGFWRGLFTRKSDRTAKVAGEVSLETIHI